MTDTSVELCGLKLDNPVVPGQRNLRLRQRVPRVLRHQHPRVVLVQGYDARGAFRQSHAAHRRVRCGDGQCRGVAEPRHRRRDPRGAAAVENLLPKTRHRQYFGFLGRRVRLLLRAHRQAGAGGADRGQRLVPQRAARRHVVRDLSGRRRRGDARREGRDDEARLHQTFAQRA